MKKILLSLFLVGFLTSFAFAVELEIEPYTAGAIEVISMEVVSLKPLPQSKVVMTFRLKKNLEPQGPYGGKLICTYSDKDGVELHTYATVIEGNLKAGSAKRVEFYSMPPDAVKIHLKGTMNYY